MTSLDSTLSLTWTAPFTLDITDIHPDISGYCVDVVNSTSSSTLHSECVNVTEFSYPTPPDTACHIYTFTVTPVNAVGNGTADSVPYIGASAIPEVIGSCRIPTAQTRENITLAMTAPVCNNRELIAEDLDTGESVSLAGSTVTFNITFTTTQLIVNRHYNVTVEASNVAGSVTSYTTINTHAITGAAITVTPNAVDITAAYFEYSDARGALFSFVQIDSGTVDFTRSVLAIVDRDASNYTLPFGLSAGHYAVFVYDIESDGTLSSGVGYPAVRNIIVITENTPGFVFMPVFSVIESCRISNSFRFIWVECTYPVNSIVAGFQMTAQLRNSSQVHKLFSGKATSPQTSVAIAVEENGIYQVSIIGIRRGTGIVESEVEHVQIVVVNDTLTMTGTSIPTDLSFDTAVIITIGSVFWILILVIVILVGVISVLCCKINCKSQKPSGTHSTADNMRDEIMTTGESQLYAEIRDPEPSCSATQNVVTPPSVPAPRGPTSPYYEDVDVPKSGGDYQLTQCEAYGVH